MSAEGTLFDDFVRSDAVLSDDGQYRYLLTRTWQPDVVKATFVMLNPSTADASVDDPTIRRCIGFARSWGMGGIAVLNLYALRSTDPEALWSHPDPVGPENDEWLRTAGEDSPWHGKGPLIAAWGAHARPDRVARFLELVERPVEALHVTKAGAPGHPLYLPATSELKPWPAGADR